jgi:hypothetical protein
MPDLKTMTNAELVSEFGYLSQRISSRRSLTPRLDAAKAELLARLSRRPAAVVYDALNEQWHQDIKTGEIDRAMDRSSAMNTLLVSFPEAFLPSDDQADEEPGNASPDPS